MLYRLLYSLVKNLIVPGDGVEPPSFDYRSKALTIKLTRVESLRPDSNRHPLDYKSKALAIWSYVGETSKRGTQD